MGREVLFAKGKPAVAVSSLICRRSNDICCNRRAYSGAQLTAAKKQIIGQIGVASDNFENNALDMGKAFLHYGKFEGPGEVFKRIEALTAEQLLEIANEMFTEEYLSTLVYS